MGIPQHIAIIMDGNGRWAKQRLLPRIAGHQQGVESVRAVVSACLKARVPNLTLFGFSSENWQRPKSEIDFLFNLFHKLLENKVDTLHEKSVRLKIVGNLEGFSDDLKQAIQNAEELTKKNTLLRLNIAFNYGGRWDIISATKALAQRAMQHEISLESIDESHFASALSLADCPDPDLLIRTSGEFRLSNFLLWQCAYAELYFTDTLWPDFREENLDQALTHFSHRQRRFGTVTCSDEPLLINKADKKAHA